MEWYKGDGVYGDGPHYHWDYYNSYVIHPMLLEVLRICAEKQHPLGKLYLVELERAQRYAVIQERLIAPDASFPVMGRSSAYRFGAFQTLSAVVLMFQRTTSLDRGGLGHQPHIGDGYISTGSLYRCTVGLLDVGLAPNDPFWSA